ncbi:MAG: TatD family hydrolase [Prevotellaceae bacterium]|nr:TatD family hydrolase [Prevotellaceae bacterium]
MTLLDFHTHRKPSDSNVRAIVDGIDTWGIHPWACEATHSELSPNILAVGECGLDRLSSTPWQLQLHSFRRCIEQSERLQKPLFLHCVRAADECLQLRKETQATQPWIWHGFRGKPQQLRQLLPFGFYFSFGFRYNPASLTACPIDRLLIETDDDPRPVSLLYAEISQLRAVSVETLASQMQENYQALFGE